MGAVGYVMDWGSCWLHITVPSQLALQSAAPVEAQMNIAVVVHWLLIVGNQIQSMDWYLPTMVLDGGITPQYSIKYVLCRTV